MAGRRIDAAGLSVVNYPPMKNLSDSVVSFTGVLEVAHALPGRMRLRIPSLARRPRALADFAAALKRLDGISEVTANPVLGTALVRYDAARLAPSLVVAAATRGFDFETAFRRHRSLVGGELQAVYAALNQAVLRRTGGVFDMPALMTVLLIVTFVRGVAGRGGPRFSPLAVLWWLQRSFSRTGD